MMVSYGTARSIIGWLAIFLSSPTMAGGWSFTPYGGSYLGRSVGQTWTAGGRCHYLINPALSIGPHYGYARLMPDATSAFGQGITDRHMHIVTVDTQLSNEATLKLGKKIVPMDFYLTLGPGATRFNHQWEPLGLIGGGVLFHAAKPWLGLAVDVNNYLHMTPAPNGNRFDADTLFTLGVALHN